jgi:hypothetical protein
VAVCAAHDAANPVLIAFRHFVREWLLDYDKRGMSRLADWLVAEHVLTLEQAGALPLAELLGKLRGNQPAGASGTRPARRKIGRPKKTEKDSATLVVASARNSKVAGY